MRTALAVPLLLVALALGACSLPSPPSRPAVPTTTTTVPASAAPSPVAAPRPPTTAVTRVIDGDTFEIEGGARVRLLGIDACEMSTPGGEVAKAAMQAWVDGQAVALSTDGQRATDRYGRLLRRASVDGTDLGLATVPNPNVGVYAGRNDASAEYVAELRAADVGERDCSGAPPADSVVAPEPTETYVGGSDGDDGESRFCRKRRWC